MPSEELRRELEKLQTDADLKPLRYSVERLKQIESELPKMVEDERTVSVVIDMLRKMAPEMAKGRSPEELAEATRGPSFLQPGLDAHTVYQASEIFQFIVKQDPARPQEPRLEIAIVPLVMDLDQAKELAALTALDGCPEEIRHGFEGVLKLLGGEVGDWIAHYPEPPRKELPERWRPEDWRPFVGEVGAKTLGELIAEAFALIEEPPQPLVPRYVDVRKLDSDRKSLFKLRRKGCIAVLDTLSLYHPEIQMLLQRTLLDVFPNTLVVKVAPMSDVLRKVVPVVRLMEPPPRIDREFQNRYSSDKDRLCELADESERLTRFIKNSTPVLWSSAHQPRVGSNRSYHFGPGPAQ